MNTIPTLGKEDFIQKVENNNGTVLVDFYATWCGPCKSLAPVLDELADEMEGKIDFVKINVEDEPDITLKYNVRGMPTLVVFKQGKPVESRVGALPYQAMKAFLLPHVQASKVA